MRCGIDAFAAPRRHQLLIDFVIDIIAKEVAVTVAECNIHSAAVSARWPSIARNVSGESCRICPIDRLLIVHRIPHRLRGRCCSVRCWNNPNKTELLLTPEEPRERRCTARYI